MLLTFLVPGIKWEKREFNKDTADQCIHFVLYFLDAAFKAENSHLKKNIILPEERPQFTSETSQLIENIIFFLHSFNTQIFSLSRNERQTFAFILENINDYLQTFSSFDEKDQKSVFNDYKFWIDNFFKIIDQKISGILKREPLSTLLPVDEEFDPDVEVPVFSNSLVTFDLYPFLLASSSGVFRLESIREGRLVFKEFETHQEWIFDHTSALRVIFEFLISNLAFREIDGIKDLFQQAHPLLYKQVPAIEKAYQCHQKQLFEESIHILQELDLENLQIPRLYLMQIRNFISQNRDSDAKRLVQRFLLHYPHFSEGHEIMGDIYFKEENPELALSFYEKASLISQNRNVGEKTKKVKDVIEKSKAKADTVKNDLFFNISDMVLQTEERLISREKELRQMIEILISKSKRNLLLIGDKGVGKSTLIRMLAQKLLFEEIPSPLHLKKIKEVNFVSLLTGSKYRGQFEEKVLKFFQDFRNQDAILVLEDIHLMVSSGAARGTSLDLVNILKSFLRENSIQVIATTDYEEFKNTLEKDNSFLGFFQKIIINEMTIEEAESILKIQASALASKEQVLISSSLLREIVETAKRDLRDRKLPDAAIILLERAVAKIRLRHHLEPQHTLTLQESDLKEVVADFLNIPETDLSLSWKERLKNLTNNVRKRIKGQDEAVERITAGIVTSKLGLELKKNRPKGVFLFIGPTGVGKTETALAITEALYNTQDHLIRIDMSEYMEKFTYSRFIGAAPGYVGYYDSNQLTDKVRQNPYSVILLDEIEKADAQLLNIFLQVFDAGRLTDARGNVVDFSNTTVIMTSNIGTSLFSKSVMGYQGSLDGHSVSRPTLIKSLKKYFSPEFLNRIDEIVIFRHLNPEVITQIIQMQLLESKKDLGKQGKELIVRDDAIEWLAKNGYSPEYGARNLNRIIKNELLEKIGQLMLEKEWDDCHTVLCQVNDSGIEVIIDPLNPEIAERNILERESTR